MDGIYNINNLIWYRSFACLCRSPAHGSETLRRNPQVRDHTKYLHWFIPIWFRSCFCWIRIRIWIKVFFLWSKIWKLHLKKSKFFKISQYIFFTSVSVPRWFQCGSGSGSSISGQCGSRCGSGSRSRVLGTRIKESYSFSLQSSVENIQHFKTLFLTVFVGHICPPIWKSIIGVKTVFRICAAKAFYSCPAIISSRLGSQNTPKESQLNSEKDSRRKQARSHVTLEKPS